MKATIVILSLVALPTSALSISQDQGQLKLRYAQLDKPYDMQVEVPEGCASDLVSVEKSDSQIVIKHRPGCHTGAVVNLLVNIGQPIKASLGAGSLEFSGFATVAENLGKVSVETKIGTVDVPMASGFSKTFDNYVGRAYERTAGRGPDVELKVNAGLSKIAR